LRLFYEGLTKVFRSEPATPELADGQRRRFVQSWILGSRCLQEWLIGLSVCVRVFTAAATTIIRSISTGVPLSSRAENTKLALCSPDDEPILTQFSDGMVLAKHSWLGVFRSDPTQP